MSLDFSLVGPTDLPMRAAPFKPVDAVGNTAAVYDLAGKMVDFQDRQRQKQEAEQTKQVMSEYLKAGGDLFTPPGIDKALQELKGKLPPDAYMKLGEGALKLKAADTQHQELLMKLDNQKLEHYGKSFEVVVPMLDMLKRGYEKVLSEKGDALAMPQFEAGKQALITQLKGSPYGNPQLLEALAKATPETLQGVGNWAKYQAQQIENRKKEADINKDEAHARMYGAIADAGGPQKGVPSTRVDDRGNTYIEIPGKTTAVKVDPNGVESVISISAIPADAKLRGAKGAGKPDEKIEIKPETHVFMAEYTRANGRPPPVPVFGIANSNARAQFLNAFADLAREEGLTGSQTGDQAFFRRASMKALSNLTAQEAVIEVGMGDIERIMLAMRRELGKLGGPDSPVVRAIWNKAETEWLGDPKFVALNQQVVNFKDVASRVLSGQSGAGATPVAFLKLSDDLLNKNMNLQQIVAAEKNIKELFDFRRKAVKQQIDALTRYHQNPDRNNEGVGESGKRPQGGQSGYAQPTDTSAPGTALAESSEAELLRLKESEAGILRELSRELKGDQRPVMERELREIREKMRKLSAQVSQTPAPSASAPKVSRSGNRMVVR